MWHSNQSSWVTTCAGGANPRFCINNKKKLENNNMALRNIGGRYFTRNIYLAAYLHLLAYTIEPEKEGNRCAFYVVIDEKLQQIIDDFFSNEARVEPFAFASSLKTVKSMMYATE